MGKITLEARVVQDGDGYLASVDVLEVTGRGATPQEAQDALVEGFVSWVQAREGQANLESTLSDAGYPGADEDTELELQFVE